MNSLVLYETFVSVVRRRIAPPRSAVRAPADVWAWVAMAMDSFVVSYEPGDAIPLERERRSPEGWSAGSLRGRICGDAPSHQRRTPVPRRGAPPITPRRQCPDSDDGTDGALRVADRHATEGDGGARGTGRGGRGGGAARSRPGDRAKPVAGRPPWRRWLLRRAGAGAVELRLRQALPRGRPRPAPHLLVGGGAGERPAPVRPLPRVRAPAAGRARGGHGHAGLTRPSGRGPLNRASAGRDGPGPSGARRRPPPRGGGCATP